MNTEKFLVAGGNPTLLVWDCPLDKQIAVSKERLESGDVEQVGFITSENGILYLRMMGNELCVNAALALASVGGETGKFFTRGIDYLVTYINDDKTTIEPRPPFKKEGEVTTTIDVRLPYMKDGDSILFDGIGYACYNYKVTVSKEILVSLAKKYGVPAFGIIEREANAITPHVYVADTDLLVNESACGSGSIAASIIFGLEDVVQPSGETIKVKRTGDIFSVSAQVKLIQDNAAKFQAHASYTDIASNNGLIGRT